MVAHSSKKIPIIDMKVKIIFFQSQVEQFSFVKFTSSLSCSFYCHLDENTIEFLGTLNYGACR